MKFLARLATGQVALWCAFWLIAIPLALLWNASGACMVSGCSLQAPAAIILVIAVFVLATLLTPFASVAVWRSASNYPRKTAWATPLAVAAKLCAAFAALVAVFSIIGLVYLGYDFVEALLLSL